MFHIKQENYQKRPTAEQRKVLHVLSESAAGLTRIQAHLKIRTLISESTEKKAALDVWRKARAIDRAQAQANTEAARRRVAVLTQEATNASASR